MKKWKEGIMLNKVMPIQNLPINSIKLINAALMEVGGFGSIKEFYDTAFVDTFGNIQWRQMYSEAPPTIEETYVQIKSKRGMPIMASYVAFDAEAPKIPTGSITATVGDMPRMKLSMDFNEKSLRDSLKIINHYGGRGNLQAIFDEFMKGNADLIYGLHSQINYSGLQIESTGKLVTTKINNGGGLEGLEFDFGVPKSNTRKAGGYGDKGKKKAWTDPDAFPIGDILDMLQYARNKLIPYGVIRMNEQTWDQLVNHPSTRASIAINSTMGQANEGNIQQLIFDDDTVMSYLRRIFKVPIEVVKTLAAVRAYDPKTRKVDILNIRAFAENTVVLRPAGIIGTLQSSLPTLDFATESNPVYTTEGGKFAIFQETYSKEKAMEFTAEFTGIPVLDIPDHMLYLNTAEAAS